jgi:hypothetical protein
MWLNRPHKRPSIRDALHGQAFEQGSNIAQESEPGFVTGGAKMFAEKFGA